MPSAEIALDRQNALAAAMVGPEVLVHVPLGTLGMRDFHRLDEPIGAGRQAVDAAFPALRTALVARPSRRERFAEREVVLHFDPVCEMGVDPRRATATLGRDGREIYFCSAGCRDVFARMTPTSSHFVRRGE